MTNDVLLMHSPYKVVVNRFVDAIGGPAWFVTNDVHEVGPIATAAVADWLASQLNQLRLVQQAARDLELCRALGHQPLKRDWQVNDAVVMSLYGVLRTCRVVSVSIGGGAYVKHRGSLHPVRASTDHYIGHYERRWGFFWVLVPLCNKPPKVPVCEST